MELKTCTLLIAQSSLLLWCVFRAIHIRTTRSFDILNKILLITASARREILVPLHTVHYNSPGAHYHYNKQQESMVPINVILHVNEQYSRVL